jgi:LPS-assembly lipoprotein
MNTRTVSQPRRGFLLGLAAAGASLGLAGCGFELRKAPVFAFKTLSVSGNTAIVNQIRRELRATGTVTVWPEPPWPASCPSRPPTWCWKS